MSPSLTSCSAFSKRSFTLARKWFKGLGVRFGCRVQTHVELRNDHVETSVLSPYVVQYVESLRHPLFRLQKYRPFLEYHTNDSIKFCFVFNYASYDYATVNYDFPLLLRGQLQFRASRLSFYIKNTCPIFPTPMQHMIRLTLRCHDQSTQPPAHAYTYCYTQKFLLSAAESLFQFALESVA